MAVFPGKRKRVEIAEHDLGNKKQTAKTNGVKTQQPPQAVEAKVQPEERSNQTASTITVQIVTGDYDKVTHGLTASISAAALKDKPDDAAKTIFTETFLLAAHTASIRSVAISPKAENNKRYLATGSADERINVYSLSTTAPDKKTKDTASARPTLNGTAIAENSDNKSLGSLVHHDRAITRLEFPTKGKLFSAAEDNTIAISRTRDWTMLSLIKAPIPKVQGRPSGDTAAPGEVPTGINDFAIHPSQKLMLSVSRGEKCMRLWNLMTGKKAGVLNFDRELLMQVGEGKHSSGEGRRVLWDEPGEHYVVGFERGAVLFGVDSKPRAICKSSPPTKLHQYQVVPGLKKDESSDRIAISTEDGRILFFDTSQSEEAEIDPAKLDMLNCVAQIGGKSAGVSSRIKDFTILVVSDALWLVVAAGSDGTIWLWSVSDEDLQARTTAAPAQIGKLVASHKSQSRITCLAAFLMD